MTPNSMILLHQKGSKSLVQNTESLGQKFYSWDGWVGRRSYQDKAIAKDILEKKKNFAIFLFLNKIFVWIIFVKFTLATAEAY